MLNVSYSQEPVSWPTMPLTQSDEPEETCPRLRVSAEMENDVPPKVKLTEGKELHGTIEC